MAETGRPSRSPLRLRNGGRWLALAIAIGVAAVNWRGQVILPALSPLVAVTSLAALRAFGVLMLLALPALALMLLVNRGFCRYACPVGLLEEKIGRLRPRAAGWGARCPRIGIWAMAMTLAGACVGYPLFLWMDPLAIFNGFFSAFHLSGGWAAVLSGMALPLVLLVSIVVPNAWCGRICPLGAMQDLVTLLRRLAVPPVPSPADSATTPQAHSAGGGTGGTFARRVILGAGAGVVTAMAARAAGASTAPPLRPPGSAAGLRFAGLCIRCGNCVRSCPAKIIHPDILARGGVPGLLAPLLRFDTDYCREDCNQCGQVCPSSAIARLPLPDKRRQRIGLAKIDLDSCLRVQHRECKICEDRCPEHAISMETSADGFDQFPLVDAALCNGCGACEAFCPVKCCAIG